MKNVLSTFEAFSTYVFAFPLFCYNLLSDLRPFEAATSIASRSRTFLCLQVILYFCAKIQICCCVMKNNAHSYHLERHPVLFSLSRNDSILWKRARSFIANYIIELHFFWAKKCCNKIEMGSSQHQCIKKWGY